MNRFVILFILCTWNATSGYTQNNLFVVQCLQRDTISAVSTLQPVLKQLADLIKVSKSAKQQVVRIVQIGDSHVQSGFFSAGIRDGLAQNFPIVGDGFWVPLSECGAWGPEEVNFQVEGKWNCSKLVNAKTDSVFGITGYAYDLASSAGKIKLSNSNFTKIMQVEILHEWNNEWSFKADSCKVNTHKIGSHSAITTFTFKKAMRKTEIHISCSSETKNLRIFGFRINNKSIKSGIDFHHYGVGGSKYSDWVHNSTTLIEQLEYIHPDLLILSLGTNDAHVIGVTESVYLAMVSQFIEAIKKKLPHCKLLFTTQPDTEFKGMKAPSFTVVNDVLKQVAQHEKAALWDLAQVMGGVNSIRIWDEQGLAEKDQMHFTSAGYDLQGRLLVYALLKYMMKEQLVSTKIKLPL